MVVRETSRIGREAIDRNFRIRITIKYNPQFIKPKPILEIGKKFGQS